MVTIKKKRLIIDIKTKEPEKYVTFLNQTLLRVNLRMLNSDDLFNDADTVDDIDNLMQFKEELMIGEKQSKRKKK